MALLPCVEVSFFMASIELLKTIQSYENYLSKHGIDEKVVNAYVQATKSSILGEKDIEYGLKLSERTKSIIESFIHNKTGGSIDALEVFCFEHDAQYEILNNYYSVLRCESPYLVDSFFRYIELDEKDPYKRFYFPRKKVLKRVIDAYQEVYDGKLDFLSVSQPKRTGKCVTETTLVCTPEGFKQIKDIKVGDLVVTSNGKATAVKGVYPQEKTLDVYEVEFSESGGFKQKTVIECCKNHLWEVTEVDHFGFRRDCVLNTEEILKNIFSKKYSVKYIEPVEFNASDVPVDPWLFGFLIADSLLCKGCIKFSCYEKDVVERVKNIAFQDHFTVIKGDKSGNYKLCYGDLIDKIHLINPVILEDNAKFIPKQYLYNSVEVREKLLQGLCDSNGIVKNNEIEYNTISKHLSRDIQILIKSLGGKCYCETKAGFHVKNGIQITSHDFYRIHISFPKGRIAPVSSKEKTISYKPNKNSFYHFIKDIRKTSKKAKMVCLEVEDDSHLYCITDNFILTHNTTSGLKLALMMGGREPEGSVFAVGKGEGLVKRFYGGLLQNFETKQSYERFIEIFPDAKKINEKEYKSAENLSIDLKTKNIFPTFTCRPIDGAIVGCTEANILVYIDDCVKNHEEARNRDRLEFLCEKVTDDVLGRRLEGTPIIIQGTKYSLYDPIEAMQKKAQELNWRWREVAIPALDPTTDDSNWEIYRRDKDGLRKIFTTDYYRKERILVSDETWASEFQQEPYEAKGRMFPESELNYFEELPVDIEPDAIMAACDTADKGDDSCSMPIGYVYGNEVYIVDAVFDNSGTQYTKPECANMLIKHNVKTVTFESNSSGGFFGRDVMEIVKQQGGRCSARYKFNCSNKITRMENARDNIIRDYYFKDFRKMDRNSQYYKFMRELTTMTRSGKVKHDDAPDSLSLFENEMRSGNTAKVDVTRNPFRSGGFYSGY